MLHSILYVQLWPDPSCDVLGADRIADENSLNSVY